MYVCMYTVYICMYVHCVYMFGTKYGFVQSMDCATQTMDPYIVRAIYGLRVHLYLNFFNFNFYFYFLSCFIF